MLSVMYMKEIIWETVKSFGPAFLAWLLAVWTSNRKANKDWEKVLKQLALTKQNNAEVQNKAYKLQFCLKQLEQLAQMYEEEISRLNIVINTVHSFIGLNKSHIDKNVMVMQTAQVALMQPHTVIMHNGNLVSVINAVSDDHTEFDKLQTRLKKTSPKAEEVLHFLNVGLTNRMTSQKFFTQYNEMAILDFSEMLTKMHKYLMDQINELFKEMR